MKNFKFYAVAFLMGAALTLPVAANAEGYAKDTKANSSVFKKLDTDKSGTISESEYRAAGKTAADFNAHDTNKDNALSLSELQPAAGTSAKDGTSAKSIDSDPAAANDSGSGNMNRQ